MKDINGTLFFDANDGVTGLELWKSDGTATGTVMVADIRTGASNSSPSGLEYVPSITNNSEIAYAIPVLNGYYTVILYFSENCASCVNSNLGGTGGSNFVRILDLDVEGRHVNAYNPADAALPPHGDGIGTTFKATEVVFRDVAVTNDVLDIRIAPTRNLPNQQNRGAFINGLAILHQAAPGTNFTAPSFRSISHIGNSVRIDMNVRAHLPFVQGSLLTLALEESADLETWIPSSLSPSLFDEHVTFDFTPDAASRFYRALLRNP